MNKVVLGNCGIKVSAIGFGTMTLGDRVDAQQSERILDTAFERGIDFFDTANTYNAGRSESILGDWMRKRANREHITLSTKVRNPVGGDPRTIGLSPTVIAQQVDASLRRLGTEYVDILFFHQPDYTTAIDISLRAADRLISSGKVLALGMSNYAAWQITDALHIANQRGWARPSIVQPMYNAIARGIEAELVPMMKHYGLGSCAYNPLAGGLLTGKYAANEEPIGVSRLVNNQQYRERYWHDQQRTAAAALQQLAEAHQRSPVELAMRFALDSGCIDNVLIGATSEQQLNDNIDAVDKACLSDEELQACDRIWEQLKGPMPKYNR